MSSMKVLYATDAFPSALQAGVAIKRWIDSMKVRVTALSVVHANSLAPQHLLLELDPRSVRAEQAFDIVQGAVSTLRDGGFEATPEIAEGHPGREIVGAAERGEYDLIVLGAGSHSWLKTRMLGSVSNYVVHSAHCSVLVVHEIEDDVDNKVLLAVDGSTFSSRAAEVIAKTLDSRRCKVEVLSVASVLAPVLAPVPGAVTMLPLGEAERTAALDLAEGFTTEAADLLRERNFDVTTQVLAGPPGPTIVDQGLSGGFDLVALGARGRGPLLSAVLGSVSDPVVRKSRAALVAR